MKIVIVIKLSIDQEKAQTNIFFISFDKTLALHQINFISQKIFLIRLLIFLNNFRKAHIAM